MGKWVTGSEERNVPFGEWSSVFVAWGLLMVAAMLGPELTQNLVRWRALTSIWVTMLFLTPAVCVFFWPGDSPRKRRCWLLFWTAGLLAYLVHFYYTVGDIFGWSVGAIYAAQGPMVATSNFIDTGWWILDVLLGWATGSTMPWIRWQRVGATLFIPATFFVSAVLIKHGFVRALGLVMTAAICVSLLARLLSLVRRPAAVRAAR